jgi:hypothetical protein
MTVIYIASFLALALSAACLLVLRKLTRPRVSAQDLNAWIDINWQSSSPLERLLDPAEFELLLDRGLSRERVNQVRARRRVLFRMYLRRLTQEFNTAHEALEMVLVGASIDRPDLVGDLNRQRLLFYRGLIGVEVRLALNALGFDAMPSLDLLRPLERLHIEFCRLAPAMPGAPA